MIKINERKYTTRKALAQLDNLILSLEKKLNTDIETVESDDFNCVSDFAANQGWYLYSKTCFWSIEEGQIYLVVEDYEDKDIYYKSKIIDIEDIDRVNFKEAIKELENVIEKYNALCEEKDNDIEWFMNFYDNYNKTLDKG